MNKIKKIYCNIRLNTVRVFRYLIKSCITCGRPNIRHHYFDKTRYCSFDCAAYDGALGKKSYIIKANPYCDHYKNHFKYRDNKFF